MGCFTAAKICRAPNKFPYRKKCRNFKRKAVYNCKDTLITVPIIIVIINQVLKLHKPYGLEIMAPKNHLLK